MVMEETHRKIIIAVGHGVVEARRTTLGDLDVLPQTCWEVSIAQLQQVSVRAVLVAIESNNYLSDELS